MIIRAKAPLRIGLAGGGTDVTPYCDEYGGYVLNATINLFAYCTIETTKDSLVVFSALDRGEECISKPIPAIPFDGNLDLHKAVYNRIVKQFNNGEPLQCKIYTYSDVPAGSGLGSSSTLVVTMVTAFVEWLKLPLGEYDIAHLAFEIERLDLGLSGGRQDQYAATFGGVNFMEFYADDRVIVNPLRVKNWILNELENSMILYFTATSRESATIIDEQKIKIKEHNKQAIEATHRIKEDALKMKESILLGDISKIAEILNQSWTAKKKLASGITNDKIDNILSTAMENGAYSGKISGAGGGGFIILMAYPTRRIHLINILNNLGGKVISFNFTKGGCQSWVISEKK